MRAASRCVADDFTCAVLDDKSVKCFGENAFGWLGLGDNTDRDTPTAVSALGTSVVQIACGGTPAHAARVRVNVGARLGGRESADLKCRTLLPASLQWVPSPL